MAQDGPRKGGQPRPMQLRGAATEALPTAGCKNMFGYGDARQEQQQRASK